MRLCVFLFGREVLDVTLTREAADEPETVAVAGNLYDAPDLDDDALTDTGAHRLGFC